MTFRRWLGTAGLVFLLSGCAFFTPEPEPTKITGDYYTLSETDVRPVILFQPAPVYPPDLLRSRIEGSVMISALLDEKGAVAVAEIERESELSADDLEFGRAAVAAISQWRYSPGMKGGVPVRVAIRIPIQFGGP